MNDLFLGGLVGDAVVTGWTGRAVENFTVEYFGQWSIGADALHLDETRTYPDGRREQRNWALQMDRRGRLVGYDAERRARLRATMRRGRTRVIYDEPLGGGAEIAAPRTVIDFVVNDDGSVRLEGREALLGLPYQRTHAVLRRTAARG